MGDTTGKLFKVTNWGESHGPAIGGVIEGCPSGIIIDVDKDIMPDMDRRKPGQNILTTQRNEDDIVKLQSGVLLNEDGTYTTTGSALAWVIGNTDANPKHYANLAVIARPNHGDYTMKKKYGIRDPSGGGRTSARMTANDVCAGAIAKKIMNERFGTTFLAYVVQIGDCKMQDYDRSKITREDIEFINGEVNKVRCPDHQKASEMEAIVKAELKRGDSIGGIVECYIDNVPVGLGEPWYDRLDAELMYAIGGINAVKGVEIGEGFRSASMRGSEFNDIFEPVPEERRAVTKTNNSGGIQAGISNGMPIYIRAAFKPTATLMQDQDSINLDTYEAAKLVNVKGRHDPCVVLRAPAIVEARAALVLVDNALMQYGKMHYRA